MTHVGRIDAVGFDVEGGGELIGADVGVVAVGVSTIGVSVGSDVSAVVLVGAEVGSAVTGVVDVGCIDTGAASSTTGIVVGTADIGADVGSAVADTGLVVGLSVEEAGTSAEVGASVLLLPAAADGGDGVGTGTTITPTPGVVSPRGRHLPVPTGPKPGVLHSRPSSQHASPVHELPRVQG